MLRYFFDPSTNVPIASGISLADNTPAVTANRIYNIGGSLCFNGVAVGGGGITFPLTVTNGGLIQTDQTAGHTFSLTGYNGTSYDNLLTVTNALTPTLTANFRPGSVIALTSIPGPTAGPTVAAGAAGALTGVYHCIVTFKTSLGETVWSPDSGAVTVAGQKIDWSNIPIGPDSRTTSRRLWRTLAGGAVGSYYLVTMIADNTTTTYTGDNLADATLQSQLDPHFLIGTTQTAPRITMNGVPVFRDDSINLFIGYATGGNIGDGSYTNVAVGDYAGQALATNAAGNALFGNQTGMYLTGSMNTLLGTKAGHNLVAVNYNTMVGDHSGWTNTAGSGNVYLGNSAGYYETGSNKLFIDNVGRASEADGRAKALIYGVFDAVVANQSLTVNANLILPASVGVTLGDGAPGDTTRKLYQVAGALMFDGNPVGSGLTWPLTVTNGGLIQTDTTVAHTFSLAGYNGSAYVNLLTVTNAAAPFLSVPVSTLGIGLATAPAAKLHILSTTEQLRLGYDAAKYAEFVVDSSGYLTVTSYHATFDYQVRAKSFIVLNADGNPSDGFYAFRHGSTVTDALALYVDASDQGVLATYNSANIYLRPNTNVVILGTNINGVPTHQTLKAANGITGTDIAGANLTLQGGLGTGAGTPGNLIFQTATAGSTGTTAETYTTRLTISPTGGTFVGNVDATTFSAGGTAGADGGPFTLITAITVKKGIVTAITGS